MDLEKDGITRREFVKGAAVTVAGGILVGCAPKVTNEATATTVPATEAPAESATATLAPAAGAADETVETQVVVVGSGMGGFTAALSLMEMGATNVVLIEKAAVYGGGTNFAECNGPGESDEAAARKAAQSALVSSNYIADPMLHYSLAIHKKEDTDWLFTTHAVELEPHTAGPYFYKGGNGMSAIKTLSEQAAQVTGLELRLNTAATELILDDPYTVSGVRAKDGDGKVIDFKAKAVVLATGGISTNKEVLAQYSSVDLEKVRINGAQSGEDGDGHKMVEATAHGKATWVCVSSLFLNVIGFEYASPMGVCAGMQPTNLWVNQDAIRFANEECVSDTSACNKVVEIQGSVYSIMDQTGFDKYAAGACQTHYSGFADKFVGNPIENLTEDYEKYKDLEDVFQADTLDDLATKMGLDVATFKATVEKYNGYADAAAAAAPTAAATDAAAAPTATETEQAASPDVEWGKSAANIWKIETGPFYGFRLASGMLNTNGGVRINTNAQVVDPRYKVISGLYATGILTSGWCGERYLGGTCQPVALWGGRRAAEHITANLL